MNTKSLNTLVSVFIVTITSVSYILVNSGIGGTLV